MAQMFKCLRSLSRYMYLFCKRNSVKNGKFKRPYIIEIRPNKGLRLISVKKNALL